MDPRTNCGLVIYLLGSKAVIDKVESKPFLRCRDQSHGLHSEGKRAKIGMVKISDEPLKNYPKIVEVDMEGGGM